MSPYELAVGLRYTRARRGSGRNTFISFIALTSMAGIALGVAALIVVLSVMNGFQEELRNRILSVASHIEIRGLPTLADDAAIARDGHGQSPREGRGAVRAGPGDALRRRREPRRHHPRHRSGRAKTRSPTSAAHMRAGALADLKPGEFGIVLGAELARALGVRAGRPGRRHHAAGHDDAGRHAAAAQDASRWSACSRSACTSSTAAWR